MTAYKVTCQGELVGKALEILPINTFAHTTSSVQCVLKFRTSLHVANPTAEQEQDVNASVFTDRLKCRQVAAV